MLNPQVLDKIKKMMVQEKGMEPEEAEKFVSQLALFDPNEMKKLQMKLVAGDDEEAIEDDAEKEMETEACDKKYAESVDVSTNDILTESQKNKLKSVIDSLVEERVQEKTKAFVNKYTKFIVESTSKKLIDVTKEKLFKKVNESIESYRDKTERVARSVILEASSEINHIKDKHKQLLESFKQTAPQLIESEVEKRSKELNEEALKAIEKYNKREKLFESILDGLEDNGYMINEDIEGKIEKMSEENYRLKTEIIKREKMIKINQLTEGLLPNQKERVIKLLEDCPTAKKVEEQFNSVKEKILSEEYRQVKKEKEEKKNEMNEENEFFVDLLEGSKEFLKRKA